LIRDRTYTSSLICSKNNSVIYILSYFEFERVFKSNEDIWKVFNEYTKKKELRKKIRCS